MCWLFNTYSRVWLENCFVIWVEKMADFATFLWLTCMTETSTPRSRVISPTLQFISCRTTPWCAVSEILNHWHGLGYKLSPMNKDPNSLTSVLSKFHSNWWKMTRIDRQMWWSRELFSSLTHHAYCELGCCVRDQVKPGTTGNSDCCPLVRIA